MNKKRPGALLLDGGISGIAAARNLARHGVEVVAVGYESNLARRSGAVSRFIPWPKGVSRTRLVEVLPDFADQYGLDGWVLFPFFDSQLQFVSEAHDTLRERFALTTPPWRELECLVDKRKTYEMARSLDFAIPESYVPDDVHALKGAELTFPVVLKPAYVSLFYFRTGVKAHRANTRDEAVQHYAAMSAIVGDGNVVVQELLPDPSRNLYSYGGFFQEGRAIAGVSVRRMRQYPVDFSATSTLVEAVDLPELKELACRFLTEAGYTGLAEVELMWNPKRARYEMLEVNARLWAWHGYGTACGLDLPYAAFAHALGEEVPAAAPRHGRRWIRFSKDVCAARERIAAGDLTVAAFILSLRFPMAYSLLSLSDPGPFLEAAVLEPVRRFRRRLRQRLSTLAASLGLRRRGAGE